MCISDGRGSWLIEFLGFWFELVCIELPQETLENHEKTTNK